MAEHLPPGLLEACVVVGASSEKLKEAYESAQQGCGLADILLDPEVLHVHVPPFVSKEHAGNPQGYRALSRAVQTRRSFIKKKRERPAAPPSDPGAGGETEGGEEGGGGLTEDVSVPKDIDLMALPQLCFPGGLQVTNEQREERFHFLVFTNVFGNQTHGIVAQCSRPFQGTSFHQNRQLPSAKPEKLFTSYAVCVISKHRYYTALRDCLSCLLLQLRTCRMSDFEERVKEFAAKLALVPIPPPGQLHVMFSLRPLTIVLPSREDKEHPVVDLDLHLPLLCFRSTQLLQIIGSILTEQRLVFFSSDWSRLTLMAECFILYIHPLSWQHPYVPVLSRQMLDFVMAPTAFLMGCHLSHYDEVASETDDLILINIDNGTVSSSCSEIVDVPAVPLAAKQCFIQRRESLQLHYDLQTCHQASSPDLNELRAQRRQWQHSLNGEVQRLTLELIVNIFREVSGHLNFEHRVFNSQEFLKTREPADQPFYKKVLETHIFHSFLKDRLNRKMDAFTRMELSTRSETQRMQAMIDNPRRPTMREIQARKNSTGSEPPRLNRRLGMSLPNLGEERSIAYFRQTSLAIPESVERGSIHTHTDQKIPSKPIKQFKLPDFPHPLVYHYVQNYYSEMILLLGKAIFCVPPENSTLLARLLYLRGFINTLCSRYLDALSDFQNLYTTDVEIFPSQLVRCLVDSLQKDEHSLANRRPELKRLICRVKKDQEEVADQPDDNVTKFELPRSHMPRKEFVKRVQESGIVRDVATIHRLFNALLLELGKTDLGSEAASTDASKSVFYFDLTGEGQQKQVDPEVFRVFYTFWKEAESQAQDVNLPASVIEHLDHNESVYKLSSSVKTSSGVGKIAMTQKRLFLLTEGRPGFLEITKFRDIEEVKISSAPILLLRVPSLKIRSSQQREVFEANLKAECDLWNLMVKEMWSGRRMADDHKDPQYMQQALTNVLLMDAVAGCLSSQKAIEAASKLVYFDKVKHEVPMMVPKTTLETLKHKIYPSSELAAPQTVHVMLYTPGHLSYSDADRHGNPKLWCALSGGRVVVFDAASWSMLQNCIQVGSSQLNCMLRLDQDQVWIGSQDSVIYIIDTRSMSCNKQLTEHRHEVTAFALDDSTDKTSQTQIYSCSVDGTVILWDASTLKVKTQFQVSCERLTSIQLYNGTLWCCSSNGIMELGRNGTPLRKMSLPDNLRVILPTFSSFILFPEKDQLWTSSFDSGELCLWHSKDLTKPFKRMQMQDCAGVNCMIKVKNQIWVGCQDSGGKDRDYSHSRDQAQNTVRGKIYVLDTEKHTVEKELLAHTDSVQSLCSAEDRYVLSGSAHLDGKIAIWKVE
ncbi:DENN domain-containing protein 3-like isoform X2 [Hypomesus transpacificus]|uniref:DENN domain-containing protein 3-like isoform X2 n=1 Tax=Hypomesus transpacificus TaxID=137520 RepID=UPI001F071A1B|nr:DENN domain-containing protein 3-like isoform X2 [Hypomesus transpacificus]